MVIMSLTTLFLLLLAQAMWSQSQPTTASANTIISEACRLSPYKDLCVAVISENQKNQKAGMDELAMKALMHASMVASSNTRYVKELLQKPDLDPAVEQYLIDCSEQYVDATDQLADSVAALVAGAYSDAESWVNTAITDADSCEKGLVSEPETSRPVKARNDHFRRVCHNAIAVTQVLAFSGK